MLVDSSVRKIFLSLLSFPATETRYARIGMTWGWRQCAAGWHLELDSSLMDRTGKKTLSCVRNIPGVCFSRGCKYTVMIFQT